MNISRDKVEELKKLWAFNASAAESQLRELLAGPPDNAALAAEALIELKNLYHPRGSILDRAHDFGLNALPYEHRVMHLADMFYYHVTLSSDHGLIEDYGNRLPEMANALEAIGAPHSAQIVKDIIRLATPEMLSAQAELRVNAYSAMAEVNSRTMLDVLDRADERIEHVWSKVLIFILENERAFQIS
jgi:hypothetical protein